MSLVAPLFLCGLAALLLPLWLHRRRARQTRRQPFGSTLLLLAQPPRARVRRWQQLTLLALRLLLLVVLCLTFAQPLWPRASRGSRPAASLQVIVLDTSLSMGAQGRFERARAEARHLIGQLESGQKALLVTAAEQITPAPLLESEPTENVTLLRAALAALQPGAARLDDATLMPGLDALLSAQQGRIDVHVISDFQATATPTRFGDLLPRAWPTRTLAVQLHAVGDEDSLANWAITAVARAGADIVVTVRGYHTPAATLRVALEINGQPFASLSQAIDADGQAQLRFPHPLLPVGDDWVSARLQMRDALAADNVRWAILRNAPVETVPLLTRAPTQRASRYLATALAAAAEGFAAEVQPIAGFDPRSLPRYRWIMVDDLGALDDSLAASIGEFVRNGGALFAALGERAATRSRVPVLGDELVGSAGDATLPLGVGEIDANDPLLTGLRGWDDLQLVHLWRVVPARLDRVLVSASDGTPLLLERGLGRGQVLLYTSDLNDDGNDLPLQPLFVGLLAQAARVLANRDRVPSAETAGDTLALGRAGGPAGQLLDPAGRPVLSLAQSTRAQTVKFDQSGIYQLYTPTGERLIAVNPDPLESDLAPMPAIQLARWRSALASLQRVDESKPTLRAAPLPLAPLLLSALVILVLGESLWATYALARRPVQVAR